MSLEPKIQQALDNGIKDTMWAMFWKENQVVDLDALEDSVKRLIRMATQKNAGQREDTTCIDWKSLDMELMRIAIEATALVLDKRFDSLKEDWRAEE